MKKLLKAAFILACLTSFVYAQDSARVQNDYVALTSVHKPDKLLNHEIGFNTIYLLAQLPFFNTNSLNIPQLPYIAFYNLYYKNTIGLRLGAGVSTMSQKQESPQQTPPPPQPNQSQYQNTNNSINLRLGVSYNFMKEKKVTLNAFADFLYRKEKAETITTTTTTNQIFPNPIMTTTNRTTNVFQGFGGEVGVGVKYNFYKNLSLYFEVPFVLMSGADTMEQFNSQTGTADKLTKTKTTSSSSNFILPASIYLVLRF